MKNYFLSFLFLLSINIGNAQYKVVSMCVAKVNPDKNGKLPALYKPGIPVQPVLHPLHNGVC
jgi:hypothetical protein